MPGTGSRSVGCLPQPAELLSPAAAGRGCRGGRRAEDRRAGRVDCAAVLAGGARGRTHCAPFVRFVRTICRKSDMEARCARRPACCAPRLPPSCPPRQPRPTTAGSGRVEVWWASWLAKVCVLDVRWQSCDGFRCPRRALLAAMRPRSLHCLEVGSIFGPPNHQSAITQSRISPRPRAPLLPEPPLAGWGVGGGQLGGRRGAQQWGRRAQRASISDSRRTV